MTDIALQGATEMGRALRRRELSAVELLQHHLARVARLNPAINAVVVMDSDRALQRAREADAALARGVDWGPLHGLPMTVKEAFDVAGLPTTWGFEAQRHNIATRTAVAVQRLIDAGVDGAILQRLEGACDHPTTLRFPEGEYLKGLAILKA